MSLKIICTRDLEQYRRRKHNSTSINRSKRLNSACTWGTNYWPKGPLNVPAKYGGKWPLLEVGRTPSSAELTLRRLISSRHMASFLWSDYGIWARFPRSKFLEPTLWPYNIPCKVLVQILKAIAKGGGKGQYPEGLPRCGSGSDGGPCGERIAIYL